MDHLYISKARVSTTKTLDLLMDFDWSKACFYLSSLDTIQTSLLVSSLRLIITGSCIFETKQKAVWERSVVSSKQVCASFFLVTTG